MSSRGKIYSWLFSGPLSGLPQQLDPAALPWRNIAPENAVRVHLNGMEMAVLSLCLPDASGQPSWPGPPDAEAAEVRSSHLEELLSQAGKLGVFPAVFNNLWALGCTAALPADSPWLDRYRQNYARNMAIEHEQERLLEALAGAGAPCWPIKGVRLTSLLYPDLSWREISDIDLLVPRDSVGEAYLKLKELGLRDAAAPWDRDALARLLRQPSHAFPELMLLSDRKILIELHWDWVAGSFPESDPTEDREAFLVYLCRHAGKHFWSSLQWVCDIELYLQKFGERLDWSRFWDLARANGAERGCAGSFHLCSLLFERLLGPQETRVAAGAGRALSRQAAEALFRQARPRLQDHPAWRLVKVDNWRQRISRFWGWLAPPPSHWIQRSEERPSAVSIWLRRYRRLAFQAAARLAPTPGWKARLEKAADLTLRDWWTLAQAFLTLLVVHIGLRTISFETLRRWALAVRSTAAAPTREMVYRQAWLVDVAANHHPVTMLCLARSLALARLLARRGVATDLKLGVRRGEGQFQAHAWVEWRGQPVNDPGEPHTRYSSLEPVEGPSNG